MHGPAQQAGPSVVRVAEAAALPGALGAAGVPQGRPVLVLVGGAGGMDDRDLRDVQTLLEQTVLPAVEERAGVVVDGGTDSGVMRAVGRALAAAGCRVPLVGVAAEGTIVLPGAPPATTGAAEPEAHHTHIVLVPGSRWGDESSWLAAVADAVAGACPSVTLLVNGGEIAYSDVSHSMSRGRPVVVLAGSGRTADAIAGATTERSDGDPRAGEIGGSALTSVVPIADPAAVRAAVTAALS